MFDLIAYPNLLFSGISSSYIITLVQFSRLPFFIPKQTLGNKSFEEVDSRMDSGPPVSEGFIAY